MRRALTSTAALCALLAAAGHVRANMIGTMGGTYYSGGTTPGSPDPTFLFSYDDGTNTARGLLTADSLGGGSYLVTGGSLTVTGPIAGIASTWTIIPGGPDQFNIPGWFVDNVLFPFGSSGPVLDNAGLALTDGTNFMNIFGGTNGAGFYSIGVADPNGSVLYWNPGNNGGVPATVSATVVPEPATLISAGTAVLLGLGYAWRRRTAKPAA
jgi:hypothetical protein